VADVVEEDVACRQCGYNLRGLNPRHRCPECGLPYAIEPAHREPRLAFRPSLSGFERVCSWLALILGIGLLISGCFGLFLGVDLSIQLPPLLGGIVALVGWGIIRSVIVAWRASEPSKRPPHVPSIYRDPIPQSAEPIDREIDRMQEEQRFDEQAFDVLREDPKPPPTP
jgi:hypothetical protein